MIASRTPEGDAFSCKVCGAVGLLEPSPLVGDAVCPRCGSYLSRLLASFNELFGRTEEPVHLGTTLDELTGGDSLDLADLMTDLERTFGLTATADDVAQLHTVEDLIRYLQDLRTGN